ncbi:type II toxin-antitoxin system RelE/ParE family toxin [candidate division KSB1 bacterium]|nr:type II toxin-antitoxin system RelE/ParE family toxin [candidate division KSB1 bacterium]
MIVSFRHKGLEALYHDNRTKGISQALVKRVKQILALLDTAKIVEDMNLPGLRLHTLKGNLKGYYAVSVSGNWRIIFQFAESKARNVDLIDYH